MFSIRCALRACACVPMRTHVAAPLQTRYFAAGKVASRAKSTPKATAADLVLSSSDTVTVAPSSSPSTASSSPPSPPPPATPIEAGKRRALDSAMKQIEASFGKGAVMRLGARTTVVTVPVFSTGSVGLDVALGVGGVPKGRVIEVYGPEASGKTTLALHIIAEAQKAVRLAWLFFSAPTTGRRRALPCRPWSRNCILQCAR